MGVDLAALGIRTMAEVNAKPRAAQKHDIVSRDDEKFERDRSDARQLEAWRSDVFRLDGFRCRHCGRRVVRSLERKPNRAEANHVAGRADRAVRYDVRNGITLCLQCHRRVTGTVADKLRIVGTVFFWLGGRRYINARERVEFKKAA
jgi:hypothetical protein